MGYTLCNVYTVYRVPCTVCRVPCTVYSVYRVQCIWCTVCSVYTVYRVLCTVYHVPCIVYSVYCAKHWHLSQILQIMNGLLILGC